MANQLKMVDKFVMATHLTEEWEEGLKLSEKPQAEIAAYLSKKFNRTVTTLNVRGLLKMAGLRQAASVITRNRGGAHFPREAFTALAKSIILMTEALRSHERILLDYWHEIEGLKEEPVIFTHSADDEMDKHVLTLRSYLAGVDQQAEEPVSAPEDAEEPIAMEAVDPEEDLVNQPPIIQ